MGPLVAMFGREFQQYLLENRGTNKINKIPRDRMQFSVNSGRTSMGERRIEQVYSQYVADDHEDDCVSISSKRTRSPRRDLHRNAPWKQSHSNRQDVDVRSQCSDRRVRDIREDPEYHKMRDNVSRSRGEDVRSRGYYPREEHPRGSMSSRGDTRLEPKYYEHKAKDRKPRPEGYESDRRSDRRD